MNDSEIHEMFEMFPNMPDPEHYPKCVKFYIKMYKHVKKSRKYSINNM